MYVYGAFFLSVVVTVLFGLVWFCGFVPCR